MIDKEHLRKLDIVVFDLDGCLLSDKGLVGSETKRLISELKKIGMRFSFATGRLHSAVKQYAEELDINLPVISLDGAMIKDFSNNGTVYRSFVKAKHVKRALAFADKFLLNIALCHADHILYTENNSVVPLIMDKFGASFKQVESYDGYIDETLEIAMASDYKQNVKHVKNKMSFPHVSGLHLTYYKSKTHEGNYYLELRRKGSSKGKGFLKLMKSLKINPRKAAVMGDWYNDVSLFQTPALKVAVANAVPEIQKLADFITQRSNNDDGVAEFLELVLKAKKK